MNDHEVSVQTKSSLGPDVGWIGRGEAFRLGEGDGSPIDLEMSKPLIAPSSTFPELAMSPAFALVRMS